MSYQYEMRIFYTVGFLHSSGFDIWKAYDTQNKEIYQFCNDDGIKIKQIGGEDIA